MLRFFFSPVVIQRVWDLWDPRCPSPQPPKFSLKSQPLLEQSFAACGVGKQHGREELAVNLGGLMS